METQIAIFRGREIRKTLHNNEWWFVISDVVSVLTDSKDPSGYIKDIRRRDKELSKGWGQIANPLWIETPGGKQKVNCANTEGIFRIIQSIPAPKAEPLKREKITRATIKKSLKVEASPKAVYSYPGFSDSCH